MASSFTLSQVTAAMLQSSYNKNNYELSRHVQFHGHKDKENRMTTLTKQQLVTDKPDFRGEEIISLNMMRYFLNQLLSHFFKRHKSVRLRSGEQGITPRLDYCS